MSRVSGGCSRRRVRKGAVVLPPAAQPAITSSEADEIRAHMRRATATVFEVLLEQYAVEDRMKVLQEAWNRTVRPALQNEAERRALELQTFHVPFPSEVMKR